MKQDLLQSFSRTIAGRTVTVEFYPDYDMGPPWEEHDGHGPVSDWNRNGREAKSPGERVLCSDRGSCRFYDFAEAVRIAKRDGWGLSDEDKAGLAAKLGRDPTPGEIAVASVEMDFQYLKDWCEDRWSWVWRKVEIDGEDAPDAATTASLGGIDSPSMDAFAEEAFQECADYFTKEDAAAHDAACRDVATV